MNPDGIRSATIRCVTPVHAIEVPREYFEKYLAADMDVNLDLRAEDKNRKRQRVKSILQLQKNLEQKDFSRNEVIFRTGESANDLYIMEEGRAEISVEGGHKVFTVEPGTMWGEFSLLFGKPRNVTATCVTDVCKTHVLGGRNFHKLLQRQPTLKENLREICLRREFQKALCVSTGKEFPRTEEELRATFDVFATKSTGSIELETIRQMLQKLDPTYTEQDVRDILQSVDLAASGSLEWEEFKRVFDMQDGSS